MVLEAESKIDYTISFIQAMTHHYLRISMLIASTRKMTIKKKAPTSSAHSSGRADSISGCCLCSNLSSAELFGSSPVSSLAASSGSLGSPAPGPLSSFSLCVQAAD